MKKLLILLAVVALPFVSNAQELGLEANYKSKKQRRLSKFKPYQSGDLIVNGGFSKIRDGYGLSYNFGAEYMLSKKLGVRSFYSTNNLTGVWYWGGYSRASVDLTYHFIQNKRWDVYAFVGIGAERLRYRTFDGTSHNSFTSIRPAFNAGVGARYKISPNFGVQGEIGRVSSFGIFKKFSLKKY